MARSRRSRSKPASGGPGDTAKRQRRPRSSTTAGESRDADGLTPTQLIKLVKLATRQGRHFPVPTELREYAVLRLSSAMLSSQATHRNINSSIRTLVAMERINVDLEINAEGSKLKVTHELSPQAVQEVIEAYAREHSLALSVADQSSMGPTFARVVGSNGNGRKVSNAAARAGSRSNGNGASHGRNGH